MVSPIHLYHGRVKKGHFGNPFHYHFLVRIAARHRQKRTSLLQSVTAEGISKNSVVSTNMSAVALWNSIGFEVIGKVPQAFRDKNNNMIDTYIFYRKLQEYELW